MADSKLRKLRVPALAMLAVAIGVLVIWLVGRGAKPVASKSGGSGGSGAAIRAPEGPRIATDSGVRISGFVIDGAGAPVVGAEVSVELERGVPDKSLSITPAADAGVVVVDAGVAPTVHVSAATAADGKFLVGGLEPGRYRLRVTGTGLLPAEVRYVPVPSDEVRIVVARQVRIEGTVVDGTTPVANAYVGLRGEAIGGSIETRTDGKGAFHFADLPEGRYQLYAWQGALAARAVRVNRLGAGPFAPIELRLESGAIVVGKVLDRETSTGLVAAVELRPIGDDQAPRYARSGDDGVFRIEGVPHGEWIADAFAPGYTSPGGIELEAGRGIPELSLVRGGAIEGRILDGNGQPVAAATVRALGVGQNAPELSAAVDQDRLRRFSGRMSAPAQVASAFGADPGFIPRGELGVTTGPIPPIPPPGAQHATRQASIDATAFVGEPEPLVIDPARASIWTTTADGRYRIGGLPKGKAVVLALATGFAEGRSKTVVVEVGQTIPNNDIVLTPGTFITGKVTDQHGAPVVGAQVNAKPELGAPLTAFSDIDGMYKLGPLAGTFDLAAAAYGHGDARRTIDLPAAKGSTPDERREDLTLVVADAILAGTVDDATGATVAGATVELIGNDMRRSISGDDGTFSIDMLAAGAHRVRITHPDYPPVELEASASTGAKTRARLRIPLGGAIEGVLLDGASGAPIAGMAIAGDGPGNITAEATTDKAGLWKLGPLTPGRWKLVVKQPGYLSLVHPLDVPASRAPGTTSVRDVRLDLARGALGGGTVRDARGQRAANAKVSVQRADGTGPVVDGTTDTQGEFRIHDCPTGELTITATKADATGVTRTQIRPGDEILSLAIDLR
ncbi:MAG: carboxypeptidase regulatory-like domain-containing protein [Deltaproteobacteria bacterium]|nr:carboxypeptidase regulatory-like domain-containing protein [Deltaproteobacteria bacterium]